MNIVSNNKSNFTVTKALIVINQMCMVFTTILHVARLVQQSRTLKQMLAYGALNWIVHMQHKKLSFTPCVYFVPGRYAIPGHTHLHLK